MNDISTEELLRHNKMGLIPGPDETEEEYGRRIEYCQNVRKELGEVLPFEEKDEAREEILQDVLPDTKKWMDIIPDWIPIYFSNYKLAPWHGGCAWIFQLNDESPTSAFFQLRKRFKDRSKYLGYSRNEILVHELSHVGRMMFEEPQFEEVLAYRSSKTGFRRWFGPIVQSSIESMLFVIVLIMILVTDIAVISIGDDFGYHLVLWLKLIPVGMIGVAILRLWKKHLIFGKCLENLRLVHREKADVIAYRLTDEEIRGFARMTVDEIQEFAETEQEKSLRWRLIWAAYFS